MFEQAWNAQSAKIIADKQAKEERQIKTQLNELHKQTSALTDAKELTRENIECIQSIINLNAENTETVREIAKITEENQKSSKRQFIASIIVSATALLIASDSLFVSIIQLHK